MKFFHKFLKRKKKNYEEIILISILLLIFISLRLVILNSNSFIVEDEECYVGTIANEIIKGSKLNLIQLPSLISGNNFYNGRIIEGLIVGLFYLLFGIKGIFIKIYYLILSLVLVVLIYFFIKKNYNVKNAFFGMLLLIFSFPAITLFNLSQGGPHLFSTLLDVLILSLFYKTLKNKKYMPWLGFLSGIAIWANLYSIIIVISIFITWLVCDSKNLIKNLKKLMVFFIIGLSPLLISLILNNFEGLVISNHHRDISELIFNNPLSTVQKITLFGKNFGDFLFLSVKSDIINIFLFRFLLFVCLLSPLIFFRKKSKEIIFPIYLILFLFFEYSINPYLEPKKLYSVRHFVPFIYILIISISVSINFNEKIAKYIILILFVIIISINLVSISMMINTNTNPIFSPYCYESIGHGTMVNHYFFSKSDIQKTCSNVNEKYYFDCMMGIGKYQEFDEKIDCNSINDSSKPFCYYSDKNINSSNIIEIISLNLNISMNEAKQILFQNKHSYGVSYNNASLKLCLENTDDYCVSKISYVLVYSLGEKYLDAEKILCEKINSSQDICYFILGKRIGEINFLNLSKGLQDCNKINTEFSDACIEGICSLNHVFNSNLSYEECIEYSKIIK